MLSKYAPLHLFPVPATMSASMRKALYPSGSKDDPRDADLLLELLLKHRDNLRRLAPDTEATRRVQNLVEERRKLVDEKTAQSNRLTSDLKIYFPQVLDCFERLDTERVCDLLERWPTLEELQKVPPAKLRTFFRKHYCRDEELIERRLLAIRQNGSRESCPTGVHRAERRASGFSWHHEKLRSSVVRERPYRG